MGDEATTGQDPNPGGNQGDDGQGQQPVQFTQDAVNALVGRARQEAREKVQRDLVEKYGDLEALKDLAAKWQSHEESQKTEAQRLADEHARALKKKEDEAAALKAQAEALAAQLQETALKGAVERQAREMGVDGDVAWAMIDKAGLTIDDQGAAQGVKPALEALKKAKPQLFGLMTPGSPANHPAAGAGAAAEASAAVRAELKKKGRYRM